VRKRRAFTSALVCLIIAVGESRAQDGAKSGPRRTTWDGVYTDEQATRGKALYARSCAGCHKADLRGDGQAPSLIEEDFAFQWGNETVGELFQRIRTLMPSDRPNSLPAETYRDIVAFILQANAFPPGPTELSIDADALNQIVITPKRP
jgi:S-disulfanyl-L-cysteine oxidoreductase SoxD